MDQGVRTSSFSARSKLMLTGEYLVLMGAESLSLPLKPVQSLEVKSCSGISSLKWKSYEKTKLWFEGHFSLPDLAIGNTNDFQVARRLREILQAARLLNPGFLEAGMHYEVTSRLDFEFRWGLGSSSSLLVNIGRWAERDPMELHAKVSEGSGYDVAVSASESPILYRLNPDGPDIRKVNFNPVFSHQLYFVYLGEKKNSDYAVRDFSMKKRDFSDEVRRISEISREVVQCGSLPEFVLLMSEHEQIVSALLQETEIRKKRFPDFNGFVKSLGAWGGDFALFATDYPVEYLASYLKRKNLPTWFRYNDLALAIQN